METLYWDTDSLGGSGHGDRSDSLARLISARLARISVIRWIVGGLDFLPTRTRNMSLLFFSMAIFLGERKRRFCFARMYISRTDEL